MPIDLPFELWQLGRTRHHDRCLARFAKLADAVRARAATRDEQPEQTYEVRKRGHRVRLEDSVPPLKRGTQPQLAAVDESSDSLHPVVDFGEAESG